MTQNVFVQTAALFLASAAAVYAQAAVQDTPAAHDFLKPFSADSFTYKRAAPLWSYSLPVPRAPNSHVKLESFGVSRRAAIAGFARDTPFVNGFDRHDLECPVCPAGTPWRSRTTIEPFGAKLTFTFLRGRLQLFSSVGGTESWRPDGMLQGIGAQRFTGSPLSNALGGINTVKLSYPQRSFQWGGDHLMTNDAYHDQWLLESHVGIRAFLDREHNLSVGVTKGYLYNEMNPLGPSGWTSLKGDVTIRFDSIPVKAMARRFRRLRASRRAVKF